VRILQAAARLLAEDPGVSMQAIADAAGVTRLTVYRHYPNRETLETRMHAVVHADALAAVSTFPGWDGGTDAFRVLVGAMTDLVRRYPVILVRHQVEKDGDSAVDRALIQVLREGQERGLLRRDVPPDVLNATLFAVLSAHSRMRADQDTDALADGVADIMLVGIATAPTRPAP
jgi:AcrR family transcriptional regulator